MLFKEKFSKVKNFPFNVLFCLWIFLRRCDVWHFKKDRGIVAKQKGWLYALLLQTAANEPPKMIFQKKFSKVKIFPFNVLFFLWTFLRRCDVGHFKKDIHPTARESCAVSVICPLREATPRRMWNVRLLRTRPYGLSSTGIPPIPAESRRGWNIVCQSILQVNKII